MTLRRSFRPLRPQFGKFLFATVGNEIDGMPLTVLSALARLGLDPWQETERLSALGGCEALEQLARLIAEVPGSVRPLAEARVLAGGLVGLLVKNTVPAEPRRRKSKFGRAIERPYCRSGPSPGLWSP